MRRHSLIFKHQAATAWATCGHVGTETQACLQTEPFNLSFRTQLMTVISRGILKKILGNLLSNQAAASATLSPTLNTNHLLQRDRTVQVKHQIEVDAEQAYCNLKSARKSERERCGRVRVETAWAIVGESQVSPQASVPKRVATHASWRAAAHSIMAGYLGQCYERVARHTVYANNRPAK